jgi:hypothetical protein
MTESTVEIPRYPSLFGRPGPGEAPGSRTPTNRAFWWETLTALVFGLTLSYLVAAGFEVVMRARGLDPATLVTWPSWYRWSFVGYVAGCMVWLLATRRVVNRREARVVVWHWSLTVWWVGVIGSLAVALLHARTGSEPLLIAWAGTRVAVAFLLLAALGVLASRVRAGIRTASVHSGSAASDEQRFWTEVETLVDRVGSELPILEAWPTNVRRWHLARPGRVAAVRGVMVPGARVTAFPHPPVPVTDAVVEELIGELAPVLSPTEFSSTVDGDGEPEFVGLLEEADTGALRFARLGTAAEIMPWLERLRYASRCGVYRTSTPGAPSTVVAS